MTQSSRCPVTPRDCACRARTTPTGRTRASELIGSGETPDAGWVFDNGDDGSSSSRTEQVVEGRLYDHYYIAENRQHDGDDESLRSAYNFGFLGTERPDWVETPCTWRACSSGTGNPVQRQRRRRPPRPRRAAAGGRPPAALALARRDADAQPDPVLRLHLRTRPDPGDHPAQPWCRRHGAVEAGGVDVRHTKSWWVGPDEHSDALNQHPAATSLAGTASTCRRPGPGSR